MSLTFHLLAENVNMINIMIKKSLFHIYLLKTMKLCFNYVLNIENIQITMHTQKTHSFVLLKVA